MAHECAEQTRVRDTPTSQRACAPAERREPSFPGLEHRGRGQPRGTPAPDGGLPPLAAPPLAVPPGPPLPICVGRPIMTAGGRYGSVAVLGAGDADEVADLERRRARAGAAARPGAGLESGARRVDDGHRALGVRLHGDVVTAQRGDLARHRGPAHASPVDSLRGAARAVRRRGAVPPAPPPRRRRARGPRPGRCRRPGLGGAGTIANASPAAAGAALRHCVRWVSASSCPACGLHSCSACNPAICRASSLRDRCVAALRGREDAVRMHEWPPVVAAVGCRASG